MVFELEPKLKIGVNTMHRRSEPAEGPWLPKIDELVQMVEQVDRCDFDSLWVGDHISMPIPFLDPLQQIAQAAVISRRLTFGVGVYLLPLRNFAPVAKQVSTLDLMTEGRLIFGVGVGGEFPKEYEASGIPHSERGARLSDGIRVLKKFWSGAPVTHESPFLKFENVAMRPTPWQKGGPPIWCGGRSKPALRRAARIGDGWHSYAITSDMYRDGLALIKETAEEVGRSFSPFGTGHLLFARVSNDYESALDEAADHLSTRYNMNMRPAAERYGAIGTPQDVAEAIRNFYEAGVRHITLDIAGVYERRGEQLERFSSDVLPLLRDLRK
ncbi:MAG: LLM class flavin-dependent oxidoreductase [Alphaproteobacteria bacterium]|jgi:alkanesulfonate monooxygenase SsuD/methylene tetrahydromethanopterin reductase-like flavin-dependent oxidoreductase (luciferase family)